MFKSTTDTGKIGKLNISTIVFSDIPQKILLFRQWSFQGSRARFAGENI